MRNEDTISEYGLTRCEIYGALFRRGVKHSHGQGYYLVRPVRRDLGHDMLAAYRMTMDVPEGSGGKD